MADSHCSLPVSNDYLSLLTVILFPLSITADCQPLHTAGSFHCQSLLIKSTFHCLSLLTVKHCSLPVATQSQSLLAVNQYTMSAVFAYHQSLLPFSAHFHSYTLQTLLVSVYDHNQSSLFTRTTVHCQSQLMESYYVSLLNIGHILLPEINLCLLIRGYTYCQ